MVIVPSSKHMAPEHEYMPLILAPEDWATWIAGSTSNALGLCQTPRDDLIVERTSQPWAI
jgi:putative SOS response-associated peptidase YedK